MKKYITVAALLAAGTAFANALTITEDTTMSPGGNYYAAAFEFSFEIAESMTDSDLYLLGYYANANADGGYAGNVFTLTPVTGGYTLALDRVASITITDDSITGVDTTNTNKYTYNYSTFVGTNAASYVLEAGKTYTVKYLGGNNGSAAADLYLDATKVASFTGGNHNMNGGGPSGTNTLYVTVNDTAVIPEPSAFGLLAGIGALALVASRRRRK